jgi:hypothetical protein
LRRDFRVVLPDSAYVRPGRILQEVAGRVLYSDPTGHDLQLSASPTAAQRRCDVPFVEHVRRTLERDRSAASIHGGLPKGPLDVLTIGLGAILSRFVQSG